MSFGVTPPGQAEFIDILTVLDELAPNDTDQQITLLNTIQDYALKKYPGMQKSQDQDTAVENPESPESGAIWLTNNFDQWRNRK